MSIGTTFLKATYSTEGARRLNDELRSSVFNSGPFTLFWSEKKCPKMLKFGILRHIYDDMLIKIQAPSEKTSKLEENFENSKLTTSSMFRRRKNVTFTKSYQKIERENELHSTARRKLFDTHLISQYPYSITNKLQ